MKRAPGFTLIEVLVAILIMGVMFAIGYGTINQAIRNRGTVEHQQERLILLQRTMRLFVQDFAQLAPRPVRDALGTGIEPAILSNNSSNVLVTFTRGGWSNPAGVQRATLQRVRYLLTDGHVRREAFPVLDAAIDAKPTARDLIDGVKSLKFRYLTDGKNWSDTWPAGSTVSSGAPDLRLRPIAVEVTLELQDWGRIQRIIEVTQ
jgi:general secretion pathway protein J